MLKCFVFVRVETFLHCGLETIKQTGMACNKGRTLQHHPFHFVSRVFLMEYLDRLTLASAGPYYPAPSSGTAPQTPSDFPAD